MIAKRQIMFFIRIVFALVLTISISCAQENGILGADDREIIYNPREDSRTEDLLIGKIKIFYGENKEGTCTGTLIGPNLVLTAAHCFHNDAENTVYTGITTFELQASGKNREYGFIKAKKLLLPSQYFDFNDANLPSGKINLKQIENDFAVIVLDENIGEEVGWHGVKYDTDIEEVPLLLAGYPNDQKGFLCYEECYADSTHLSENRFDIDCDVVKGASGGALIEEGTGNIWGVVSGAGQGWNYAQRFSKNSFNTLKNWYQGKYDEEDTYTYDIDTRESYHIKFINKCDERVSVAYKVKKDDGYEIDGLYILEAGESIGIKNVRDRRFWVYAKSRIGEWKGNIKVYLEEYEKSFSFFQVDMNLNGMAGEYIHKFTCSD